MSRESSLGRAGACSVRERHCKGEGRGGGQDITIPIAITIARAIKTVLARRGQPSVPFQENLTAKQDWLGSAMI